LRWTWLSTTTAYTSGQRNGLALVASGFPVLPMRFVLLVAVCSAVSFGPLSNALGQGGVDGASATTALPESQIRDQLSRYVEAFNDRRFDDLAGLLNPQLSYSDESAGIETDEAVTFMQRLKASVEAEPTLQLNAQINELQLQDSTTAVVQGSAVLQAEGVPDERSDFVVTMTKSESSWTIAAIVDRSTDKIRQRTASEALDSLGWLVGTWQDDSPEKLVSTIEYMPGRQFLRRTITKPATDTTLAMEIIGYDPSLHRVRSWTYFADGSFSTGTWSGQTDHWNIDVTQTLRDGRIASGTYVIRPVDRNQMDVQIVSREVGGELRPGGADVTMTRAESTPDSTDETRPTEEAR